MEVSASFRLSTGYSAIVNSGPHGSLGFKGIALDMKDACRRPGRLGDLLNFIYYWVPQKGSELWCLLSGTTLAPFVKLSLCLVRRV